MRPGDGNSHSHSHSHSHPPAPAPAPASSQPHPPHDDPASTSSAPLPTGPNLSNSHDDTPVILSEFDHYVPLEAGSDGAQIEDMDEYHGPDAFGFENYASDDQDMSDDGGAPLADLYAITHLLDHPMAMDVSTDSDVDPDWGYPEEALGPNGPTLPHLSHQTPGVAAALYAQHTGNAVNIPVVNAAALAEQTQQFGTLVDNIIGTFEGEHPTALSNPNPTTLGPDNPGLFEFLRHWAWQSRGSGFARERGRYPWLPQINEQASEYISHVQYCDLDGDRCDFQGIDWEDLGITRAEARQRREITYKNYVNIIQSDVWEPSLPDVPLRDSESYFRFRRMDIRRNVHLSHFQLRNVLACSSRSHVFYAGSSVVHQFNPLSGVGRMAMALSNENDGTHVSTLAADHGVLIAGGFNGEYAMRSLNSFVDDGGKPECHEGTITTNASGITNHVKIHQPRGSSKPRAAFASNDMGFRVLDLETEKFVSESTFPYPLNCSALSPDRRLRVMVGDHRNVLITTAGDESPLEILQELPGHRDYGFACDWADDGWTVATGFQDKAVKIWDARRWTKSNGTPYPLETIRTEMAGVRSLRFSPVGSGKRVLVAAEEADFVNIIDGQDFRSKQTLDIIGEIGGVAFTNDGQDLHVLCCDRVRGGLLQFERCGLGAEAGHDPDREVNWRELLRQRGTSWDWPENNSTPQVRRKRVVAARRRLRGEALGALEPF
ncbi:WD domain-containing protein [Pleurostoma richardsiae]|uniref:WD domain-containing protein n=1 Tax=Pleurostoma richardsiae TaxID=41990 RepID=A0AA38SDM1_9PEZI|nr:WD domain-containing protein [Pleurostoma richardsiae]